MNGKLASAFISINPIDTDQQSLLVKKWTQWSTWLEEYLCDNFSFANSDQDDPFTHFFSPSKKIIFYAMIMDYEEVAWALLLCHIIGSKSKTLLFARHKRLTDLSLYLMIFHSNATLLWGELITLFGMKMSSCNRPFDPAPPSTDDHTIPPAFGSYAPTWPGHSPAQWASQQRRRVAWQPNNWDGALLKFNNRIRQYNNLTHGYTILICEKWI